MNFKDYENFFNDETKVFNARGIDIYQSNLYLDLAKRAPRLQLNNKRICLVGGGKSPIATELHRLNYKPKCVVNIDPYADQIEDYKIFPNAKLVKEDFLTAKVQPDFFDEIWALFSLPCYCENVKEAEQFFKKATLALAPGGHLRMSPLNQKWWIEGEGERLRHSPGGYEYEFKKFAQEIKQFGAGAGVFSPISRSREMSVSCGVVQAPINKGPLDEFLVG